MGRFIEFDGQKIDVDRQLFEIEKAECEEDLVEFIKRAFHVLEPGWRMGASTTASCSTSRPAR